MIALVYQHYKHFDQLFNCLKNLRERITAHDRFFVSLCIDQEITKIQEELIKGHFNDVCFPYKIIGGNCNQGLTVARNASAKAAKTSTFIIEQYIFCFTTSEWLVDLDENLYQELILNKGLTIYPFKNDDWLFERNFSLEQYDKVPFSTFLNTPKKPDYMMVMNAETYVPDSEFEGERYCPEDRSWCLASKGAVTVKHKTLASNWFNKDGMTCSTLNKMREVELSNPNGFYERAEFFIDLYLNEGFPLSMRLLKDFTSTLVSSHKEIPFKKYKGTIIETLLLERIKSWALNEQNDNQFKMTKG